MSDEKGRKELEQDIFLKTATMDMACEIHKVMEEVYNELADKSLYVCDDLEFVKKHIQKEGFIIAAVNDNSEIAGCFIVRYPKLNPDNLGIDIGLDPYELRKVVHLESAAVLPRYRGRGLQQAMLKYAEELIERNEYRYLMATVSPDNKWSCNSFEKNGYKAVMTKEKYNGLTRRVYLKEI